MKQKNNQSKNATTIDLNKAFEIFEKKIDKKFALQAELYRVDIKLVFNETVERFESLFTQFKNQIFTKIDPVMKELEEKREDKEISAYQISEVRQQVRNHDKRIKKLEKTASA